MNNKPANNPPFTEEQIRAHFVHKLQPFLEKVLIVDYDGEWPNFFHRAAEQIRNALGTRALEIEHTGSTSVSGLAAKPIIDKLLMVKDSADEDAYLPDLKKTGYRLRIREPEWHEQRMLKGPDTDLNLHVLSSDCAEIECMLLFRDWLRGNVADRELYARTKLALAGKD